MTKNKNPHAADGDSVLQQNLDYQAPGRAVGLSVMLSLVLFTAVFMSYQSARLDQAAVDDGSQRAEIAASPRFDAAHFSLPSDELWGFVPIPAGAFLMGSDPRRDRMAYENERWSPTALQGSVTLPDYFMGRFEVTNAQFAAYLRATNESMRAQFTARLAGDTQAEGQSQTQPPGQGGDLPVTGVTLPQMLGYARWLDAQLRNSSELPSALRAALDSGARVTLPSEAEWEKAARGTQGAIFPWGMQPSESYANFGSSSLLPVGSLACDTCSYGLSDMAGNAWELTRSPLRAYPFDIEASPEAVLEADPLWVMRGGSFQDGINNVRSAVRGAVDPSVRNATIGFRLALSTLP